MLDEHLERLAASTPAAYKWTRVSDTTAALILHLESLLQDGNTPDHIEAATVAAALASLSTLHSAVMAQAGIPAALVALLPSPDAAVVQASAKAILELSRSDTVRSNLRAAGAIPHLNAFLRSALTHYAPALAPALYAALAALRSLARDLEGNAAVLAAGGVPVYVCLLQHGFDPTTTSAAATLLAHLAATPAGAATVASANGLPALVASIAGLDPQQQLACLRCLAPAAASPDLQAAILTSGGIPTLVSLLQHGPHSPLAQLAAKSLAQLTAANHQAKLAALDANAPTHLVPLLQMPPLLAPLPLFQPGATLFPTDAAGPPNASPPPASACPQWAAKCLTSFSTEQRGRHAAAAAGAVPPLMALALTAPKAPAGRAALKCLASLTQSTTVCNELLLLGFTPRLAAMLPPHPPAPGVAAQCLHAALLCTANIAAAAPAARHQLAAAAAPRTILHLATATADATLLYLALDVLAACAADALCAAQIADAGAADAVLRLLGPGTADGVSAELAAACLRLVCALARHAAERPRLAQFPLLHALLERLRAAAPAAAAPARGWALQALAALADDENVAMYVAGVGLAAYVNDDLAGDAGTAPEQWALAVQLLHKVARHPRAAAVLARDVDLVTPMAAAVRRSVQEFRVQQFGELCGALAALCCSASFGVEACASAALMGVLDDLLSRPRAGCLPFTRHALQVLHVLATLPVTAGILLGQYSELVGGVLQVLDDESAPGVDDAAACVLKQLLLTDGEAREVLAEMDAVERCLKYMMRDREPCRAVCELLELLPGSGFKPTL